MALPATLVHRVSDRLRDARWQRIAVLATLVAIIGLGCAVRIPAIFDRPLWEDESYNWEEASKPIVKLLLWKHDPHHGPVGFLAARISMELFGTTAPWAMRLPSLLCGILAIPAGFWLGRVIYGNLLGLLVAALIAGDMNMVDQSQQSRMYTMLALNGLLTLAVAIPMLRNPPEKRGPWLALATLLILGIYTHFSALLTWICVAATLLIVAAARASRGESEMARRTLTGGGFCFGVAALLSARAFWKMFRFATDGHNGISQASLAETVAQTYRQFEHVAGAGKWSFLIPVLAAVGVLMLYRRCRVSAVMVALMMVVGSIMVHRGQVIHRIFADRYFTIVEPALWIGLAALPVLTPSKIRRAVAASVVAGLVGLQAWQSTHLNTWNDLGAWRFARTAARFVEQSRQQVDRFACVPELNTRILYRYYGTLRPSDEHPDSISDDSIGTREADASACWVAAALDDAAAEARLSKLISREQASGQADIDVTKTVAMLRAKHCVLARLQAGHNAFWAYSPKDDRLVPLDPIPASGAEVLHTASKASPH